MVSTAGVVAATQKQVEGGMNTDREQIEKLGRRPLDYYPTPAWPVYRLLEELYPAPDGLPGQTVLPYRARWVEPCAGDGALIRAVSDWPKRCSHQQFHIDWTANDIDPDRTERLATLPLEGVSIGWPPNQEDALEWTPAQRFDVALMNPPFSRGLEFVRWGMTHANTTIALLRLGFLASSKRCSFMRSNTPDVYVLPNRPSFTGDRRTDSYEYAWFIWRSSRMARSKGQIRILADTPRKERK